MVSELKPSSDLVRVIIDRQLVACRQSGTTKLRLPCGWGLNHVTKISLCYPWTCNYEVATHPLTHCPSPCSSLEPLWTVNTMRVYLRLQHLSVRTKSIPTFTKICPGLDKLHDHVVARNEPSSKEVLEYRLGHTPPNYHDQDETQRLIKEHIMYLKPATPHLQRRPPTLAALARVQLVAHRQITCIRRFIGLLHDWIQYQQNSTGTRLHCL